MPKQIRQRGKKLSPWTILNIMHRATNGEGPSELAEEFGINRTTINRWLIKWGKEANLVDQMHAGHLALKAVMQRNLKAEQRTAV